MRLIYAKIAKENTVVYVPIQYKHFGHIKILQRMRYGQGHIVEQAEPAGVIPARMMARGTGERKTIVNGTCIQSV